MNAITPAKAADKSISVLEASTELAAAQLLHDLRAAAALARDHHWKAIATNYSEHSWPPLQALAAAARDALMSWAPHKIGGAQVCGMTDPADAPIVDNLLAMFGVPL